MQKMDLEMSSALCPPFYLADDQLQAYIPHYNLHTLHWWYLFLCVICYVYNMILSHFNVWHHCCSLERGDHCCVGLAVTGCTGVCWWILVQLVQTCKLGRDVCRLQKWAQYDASITNSIAKTNVRELPLFCYILLCLSYWLSPWSSLWTWGLVASNNDG